MGRAIDSIRYGLISPICRPGLLTTHNCKGPQPQSHGPTRAHIPSQTRTHMRTIVVVQDRAFDVAQSHLRLCQPACATKKGRSFAQRGRAGQACTRDTHPHECTPIHTHTHTTRLLSHTDTATRHVLPLLYAHHDYHTLHHTYTERHVNTRTYTHPAAVCTECTTRTSILQQDDITSFGCGMLWHGFCGYGR